MRNEFKYEVIDNHDGTCFVCDEADVISTTIDDYNVERFIKHQWMVDKDGYFFMKRDQRVYLIDLIFSDEDNQAYYRDGNPFNRNTLDNIMYNAVEKDETKTIYVEGIAVLVDKAMYYQKNLFNYDFKLYQGYVVYIEKRSRKFLHKLIAGFDGSTGTNGMRYRFCNGNKLDCRACNIAVKYSQATERADEPNSHEKAMQEAMEILKDYKPKPSETAVYAGDDGRVIMSVNSDAEEQHKQGEPHIVVVGKGMATQIAMALKGVDIASAAAQMGEALQDAKVNIKELQADAIAELDAQGGGLPGTKPITIVPDSDTPEAFMKGVHSAIGKVFHIAQEDMLPAVNAEVVDGILRGIPNATDDPGYHKRK